MSRRRQRGAAYRARRTEYRAIRRGITQTARYMQWLKAASISVEIATGAALDRLMELTPVSHEEYSARIEAALWAQPVLTTGCPACGQTFIHATNCPELTP